MTRRLLTIGLAGTLLAAGGCAAHSIVGHGMVRTAQLFGNVRLTGDNNNITADRGSRIAKLSVMGDNNTVTVNSGATLAKVEFWGNGNTVTVPAYVMVRSSEVGTNQIVRRTSERSTEYGDTDADWPVTYEEPPLDETAPGLYEPPPEPEPEPLPMYRSEPNATWEPNFPPPIEHGEEYESPVVTEPLPEPIIIGQPPAGTESDPNYAEPFEEADEPEFRPPPTMEIDPPAPLETGEEAAG